MASLLTMLNHIVSYFTKFNDEEFNINSADSVIISEATDQEMNSDDDVNEPMLNKEPVLNDAYMWKECLIIYRYIKSQYYIIEEQICKWCHEISLGKDKQYFTCGEVKHISFFQKPKLLHCTQCTYNPRRFKKQGAICDCTEQYGH